MFVALLWAALAVCCAATVTASIKLRRLRKAANAEQSWHTKRAARLWAWIGNGGFIAAAGVFIVSFPLDQIALGMTAFIACIVLIFVFVSGAGKAAGEGEGAN